jgi:uncharacterized protein YbjT (DUF2867 family)
MILVTGASGMAGGAVVTELRARKADLRAMYRSKEDAAKAPAGVPAAVADFADSQSLRAALNGVNSVYLVCSPVQELVALESNMIDACAASGVTHVVQHSALGARDFRKSFPSWHHQVEEKLKASKLKYTILQANSFMQNITAFFAPSIKSSGVFYSSMKESKTSYIDVRDIAGAATNILLSPEKHYGQPYELNGPEAVTYTELAARISRVAGKPVQYVDIPEAAQRKSMLELGMPAWQVEALLELQQYYVSGKGGDLDGLLATLLGRQPRTLDAFLSESASAFRTPGTTKAQA